MAVEVFGADDKDMTAQLNKIKSAGADVMIVTADPTTHAVIIKQRKQFGMSNIEYVGSNTAVMPQTLELLTGGEAEGIYALTSAVPPEDPGYQGPGVERQIQGEVRYRRRLHCRRRVRFGNDHSRRYQGGRYRSRQDQDFILNEVKGVKGMGNVWNFSPNGDGGTQVSITQVKDGKAPVIKTIAADVR